VEYQHPSLHKIITSLGIRQVNIGEKGDGHFMLHKDKIILHHQLISFISVVHPILSGPSIIIIIIIIIPYIPESLHCSKVKILLITDLFVNRISADLQMKWYQEQVRDFAERQMKRFQMRCYQEFLVERFPLMAV